LRTNRSGDTAAHQGISPRAKPFALRGTRHAAPKLKVLDDLPTSLPICEGEAALLEANCHDLLAAILDAPNRE